MNILIFSEIPAHGPSPISLSIHILFLNSIYVGLKKQEHQWWKKERRRNWKHGSSQLEITSVDLVILVTLMNSDVCFMTFPQIFKVTSQGSLCIIMYVWLFSNYEVKVSKPCVIKCFWNNRNWERDGPLSCICAIHLWEDDGQKYRCYHDDLMNETKERRSCWWKEVLPTML